MHWSRTLLALTAAIVIGQSQIRAASVVYTENFDDISDWTVVDTATSIVASGGKLQVDYAGNYTPPTDGLYLPTAVVPQTEGRVYFWGLAAEGTRDDENPLNHAGGPVGAFNFSNSAGLKWFTDTPMGAFIRNRDEPGTGYVTELQLIADNDNPGAHPNLPTSAIDILVEYTGTTASLYLKNSTDTDVSDWFFLSSLTFTPGGSDYFLNLTLVPEGPGGEGHKWELDQIDIEDSLVGDRLAVQYVVPEPASLALLGFGGLIILARRR